MAKIRNVCLPSELNEALVCSLDTVPDSVLSEIGKKFLSGGFTEAQPIRLRLAARLRGPAALEPWLIHLLRRAVPGFVVISALSSQSLHELAESLLKLAGRVDFVLQILLDPRHDLQHMGVEMMGKLALKPTDEECRAATLKLCKFVDAHLLVAAGLSVTPVENELPDKTSEELSSEEAHEMLQLMDVQTKLLESQKVTIAALKKNLQDQSRKHKGRLEAAHRHAAEDRKRLVAERDLIRGKLNRMTKDKELLALQLKKLATDQQSVITQGVAEQTSGLVRKWLTHPLEMEQHLESANATCGDLLDRAAQALELQARQDHFTGNRLALEHKLTQLREARERLAQATQTALSPIPRLKEVLAEVEEEIARIQKVLAHERTDNPLIEKLLISVNHAADWNETRRCSEMLQHLVDFNLVRTDERRRVYDAIQRKFSLLEEIACGRESEAPDHGWSLRNAIFRNSPSLLILDGHNLLFGLEDIFRPDFDADGHPGSKARRHLVSMVRHLADSRPNLRVRICFDAPHHQTVTVSSNVEIEYSGGQGEHRADNRITEQLAIRRTEELEQKWFVVSDDRAVRREALKYGAQYVPVDLFAVLLNDFNCLLEPAAKAA